MVDSGSFLPASDCGFDPGAPRLSFDDACETKYVVMKPTSYLVPWIAGLTGTYLLSQLTLPLLMFPLLTSLRSAALVT